MHLTTAITVYIFPESSVSLSTSAVPDFAPFFIATENFRKNFIHFLPPTPQPHTPPPYRPCAWRGASVIFAVLPHLFCSLAQGNFSPYIIVFLCPSVPGSLSLSLSLSLFSSSRKFSITSSLMKSFS